MQGTHGTAARAPDTFRGHYNEGGLFAERVGAHLPGFSDGAWAVGSPVRGGEGAVGVQGPGVNFYRTTFALVSSRSSVRLCVRLKEWPVSQSLPTGADVPIRLRIVSNDVTANYRAQVYLNGWMLGKYINELGPQTDYVLPAGCAPSPFPPFTDSVLVLRWIGFFAHTGTTRSGSRCGRWTRVARRSTG